MEDTARDRIPQPVRVCFVSPMAAKLFDPDAQQPFGGAELQSYLLAKELAKDPAYKVTFVVADPIEVTCGGIEVKGYKAIKRGVPILSRFINRHLLYKTLESDIIFQSAAGVITSQTLEFAHDHSVKFHHHIASDSDVGAVRLKELDAKKYYQALTEADLVTAQNEYQRTELKREFDVIAPVVKNGFPLPATPPTGAKKGALWVASSQELKQPQYLLKLARAYPDVPFTMVMPKNEESVFKRICAELPRVPNVRFIEHVPVEQIQALFDAAQVFVNTSSIEGFPNTFVQAGMGATPILSLEIDPDSILENYDMGVCAHGDLPAFAKAFGALIADPRHAARQGHNGFDYVKKEHDIEKIIDRFKALWTNMLERR